MSCHSIGSSDNKLFDYIQLHASASRATARLVPYRQSPRLHGPKHPASPPAPPPAPAPSATTPLAIPVHDTLEEGEIPTTIRLLPTLQMLPSLLLPTVSVWTLFSCSHWILTCRPLMYTIATPHMNLTRPPNSPLIDSIASLATTSSATTCTLATPPRI